MKHRIIALLAALFVLAAACASAQQLPGVDVFSPGLVRLSERMQTDPPVHMEATMTAADAFLARDLSVLGAMLDGTTFVYDGAAGEGAYAERLSVVRGGETLFTGALCGDVLEINGVSFAPEAPLLPAMEPQTASALDFAQNTAILERAPLDAVEAFLLSLEEGTPLAFGLSVAQPFASVRTMSDDGTRLTRINISGSVAREGEAPWVVEGYLKQPAGRAPKDTFELTVRQDEDNFLEISYSSLRQSEITKKNKAGKNSVDSNVKIAGKIGGYRISTRLTVTLRNTWTADGESLGERIVVTATLTHQDNTPGRVMRRLNLVEGKMRHEIRLTTAEESEEPLALTDGMTVSLAMDEKTVLDAGAQIAMTIDAEAAVLPAADGAQPADAQALRSAMEQGVQQLARGLYAQLDDKVRGKILDGLDGAQ